VRRLARRISALKAALAARPKQEGAPRPADAVIDENNALWAAYVQAEMEFGHGRVWKLNSRI
jgi:hypothetical protein